MPQPDDPVRLTVRNRFVTVLTAITAGANYFYTPWSVLSYRVIREQVNMAEERPVYSVLPDMGDVEFAGTELSNEYMTISVFGMIESSTDLVAAIEKARADIVNAVRIDAALNSAGTLRNLTDGLDLIGSPIIHYEPGKNFATLRQDFRARIQIDF